MSIQPRRTRRKVQSNVGEQRNLVVMLDGTGNELGRNLSNVLKLFRVAKKSDRQLVYYDPGVGTIGEPGPWRRLRQNVQKVFGLATGWGLDENVLEAYGWLCRNWREGDRIWLFGFSRGAWTARVLGGLIHMIGLLRPEQLNMCGYAMVAYKKASEKRRSVYRLALRKGQCGAEGHDPLCGCVGYGSFGHRTALGSTGAQPGNAPLHPAKPLCARIPARDGNR